VTLAGASFGFTCVCVFVCVCVCVGGCGCVGVWVCVNSIMGALLVRLWLV
jgi:hypothetical protein